MTTHPIRTLRLAAVAGRLDMRRRCIAVALAETPESVLWVEPRRSLTGRAWKQGEGHRIAAPRPFTRRALYVYLHECGHIVLGHCDRRSKLRAWEREQQAENYAHDRMRAHGIAVPRKETQRAKQYVAHKREVGKRCAHRQRARGKHD